MAFSEREIVVQRPNRTPVILKAAEQEHLQQVPSILSDASEKIRRYVTKKFIEQEAATLVTDNPTYFYQLRDETDSVQWGIYVQPEAHSELLLVGFTGIGGIINGEGHSRTVIMNPDFLGQGIGKAANTGRTVYAYDENGYQIDHEGAKLEIIHSRVDIRNKASRDAVYGQGYVCVSHTPPKGKIEPDWERHLLIQMNPNIPLEQLMARFALSDLPYHLNDTFGAAYQTTASVLEKGNRGLVTLAA